MTCTSSTPAHSCPPPAHPRSSTAPPGDRAYTAPRSTAAARWARTPPETSAPPARDCPTAPDQRIPRLDHLADRQPVPRVGLGLRRPLVQLTHTGSIT